MLRAPTTAGHTSEGQINMPQKPPRLLDLACMDHTQHGFISYDLLSQKSMTTAGLEPATFWSLSKGMTAAQRSKPNALPLRQVAMSPCHK